MNKVIRTAKKAQQNEQASVQKITRQSNIKIRVDDSQNQQIQQDFFVKQNTQMDCNQEWQNICEKTSFKKVQSQQFERKMLYKKMPGIEIDLSMQKQIDGLRNLALDDVQNCLLEQNIPFYSQDIGFLEYVEKQLQYWNKMEKSCFDLSKQSEHHQMYLKSQNKQTDPIKLHKELTSLSKNNKFHLQKLESEIKSNFNNLKKLDQLRVEMAHAVNKAILQIQQEENQSQIIQYRLKGSEINLNNISRVKEQMDAKYLIDKFELCIIKLQSTNTLYRYGVKIIKSQVTKQKFYTKGCSKWDTKVKNIDSLDLKIFIITTLYPMCGSIFNDFSSQSNVYKIMYGLNFFLTEEEIQSSYSILNKRIEKYYTHKKYSSLEGCLKSANLRKRKIIFICSEKRLQQILNQLIHELKSFKNNLIALHDVQLEDVDVLSDKTVSSHKKLIIGYAYQKVSMKVAVDVHFFNISNVNKQQIQNLRKKTGKYEPVLCWFQIPRGGDSEKIQNYKDINSILSKCRIFSYAS